MRLLSHIPIVKHFWRRHRTCWRKVAHRTESEAARVARRYGAKLHAYRCPYCRKWHVGHPSEKRSR